jgi:1-deoxy-D-xylulose-5-phosphate reductoisomerase
MRVLVLGATGNIGQQALEVIKQLKYQLVGISFYKNNLSALQINTPFRYSPINKINSNVSSYDELIKLSKPDIVINAIVGFAGLEATIVTIKNKKTLCLANKESLVVAGQFITKMANRNNVKIYPIDSEDSSIYQIISQNKNSEFKKLYITASGGPFYKHSLKKLSKATYKQAVNHPT